jgi:hypothetical protein
MPRIVARVRLPRLAVGLVHEQRGDKVSFFDENRPAESLSGVVNYKSASGVRRAMHMEASKLGHVNACVYTCR